MKRKSLLILLLLAAFAPWTTAQETLTVYDQGGSTTSQYVPIYGYYADYGCRSQFIIPADKLEAMQGGTIEKLTFYIQSSVSLNETFTVYLKVVDYTSFSGSMEDWSTMTAVWTNTVSFNSDNEMVIDFSSTPFEYEGGNLMIGFQVTNWGSSCPRTYWFGESQTTVTVTYNYATSSSHSWSTMINSAQFLPKTTFTYEPAQEGDCDKPETLVAEALSSETATLNWGGGSGTYNVEIKGGSYTDWSPLLSNTTQMTTMVENLTPNTAYQVRVQSVCTGETPTSGYKTTDFKTPCDNLCEISYSFTDQYDDSWNGASIKVVDVATNEVIESLTMPNVTGPYTGSFSVCDGMQIKFVWNSGSFDGECSYTFTDINDDLIFSGTGAMSNDVLHTVSCVVSSCLKPNELGAVTSSNEAELSWTARSGETSWSVFYKKVSDANYTEVPNVTDNPYTLESLDANTDYQFYVVANCPTSETSDPSEVFPFTTKCDAVTTFPWTENFESMTANTVPMCWDNSATTGTGYGSSPWYYWGVYEYNGNKMIRMNNYFANGPLAIINSPIINLPAEPKELTFDYTHNANSGAFSVKISEDGGTTFTELMSYTIGSGTSYTDPGTFTEATISLADYANKSVILQFYSEANYGTGAIFVDNIKIDKAPTCLKPTMNNMATNIEATSATVSWTAGGTNQDHWDVYYSTTNTAPTASTVPQIAYTTDNPCTLTGLSAYTPYYVWVRGNCGTVEEPDYSDWSSAYCGFTTKAFCLDMMVYNSSIVFADLTSESVTVNFEGAGAATEWKVQLSTASDFSANLHEKVVNTASASFDGLEANKTYFVRVAPYCDEADDYTPWSPNRYFKTYCGIVTIDETHQWEEGFEDYNVGTSTSSGADVTDIQCWERVQVSNSTPKVYRNYEAAASTGLASLELKSSSGNPAMIALPEFSAPIKDLSVAFNYNCTSTTNTYTAELGYISNVTDATSFVKLFDIPTPVGRGSYTSYSQDLYEAAAADNAPAGSRVAIKFVYNPSTYSPPSWNFDDFQVSYVMGCRKPVDLTYAEVKSTSVKLNWVKTDDAQTSWEVAYCDETATPTAYQVKPANTNVDFVLGGLNPETPYKVKVRTNCGTMEEPDYSDWSNEISFTTAEPCMVPTDLAANNLTAVSANITWTGEGDSYNVMYRIKGGYATDETEDFSGQTAVSYNASNGQLPEGWMSYNSSSTAPAPRVSNSSNYDNYITALTGNFLLLTTTSTGQYAYAIMPKVSNLAQLEFSYAYESISYGTLTVGYVTDNTDFSTYQPLDRTPDKVTYKYTFTLTEEEIATINAANGYVTFRYESGSNTYYSVGIDDVVVRANYQEGGEWQSATSDTESITLENLTAGTTYGITVQSNCDGGNQSIWCQEYNFTTLAEGTKVFVAEGNWNEGANWAPAGAPAITDNVIIRANTTIPADCVALADKITVEGTNTITIEDGGQLLHSTVAVYATMKKQVQPYEEAEGIDNYILLASPMQPTVFAEAVENLLPLWYENAPATFNVDFYQFDNSQELEWVNLENSDEFQLVNGEGYLYAHNWESPITLAFKDALMYSHEPKAIGLDYNSGNANWAGWNLIGNPFPCNATVSNAADPLATFNYYKINAAGEFVTADGTVAPMEGIFALATEAGQEATFTRVEPGENSIAPTDGILNVNLMSNEAATRKGNSRIDMARLRFGHGNNLGKLNLFRSNATVFFPQDGKDYSVMYAEAQGEMPLHFKAEKNGTYTLGFTTEDVSFGYLHLIDNMTGNDVDLLATPSYTFDARTTDYASRFRLVFSANGSNSDDNGSFGFIDAAGNLVITDATAGATLQIIDVMGRVVVSRDASNASAISTKDMTAGVYMLRLINGTNVKVQKIVVK